ncbi:MAG: hypothetical protein ABEI98_03640 [Halorhabdus sp.]
MGSDLDILKALQRVESGVDETKAAVNEQLTAAEFGSPLNSVQTNQDVSFFNHMFASVPADELFSSLWFDEDTSANGEIQRSGSEAVLHVDAAANDHAQLETTERTNYAPGDKAVAGWAVHTEREPVGEQDLWAGATDGDDGAGIGIREFNADEGTPTVSSAGVQPYAFFEAGGNNRVRVPQEHWNQDTLDGSGDDNNPSGRSINNWLDGAIVRIDPQLYYGHGEYTIAVLTKGGSNGTDIGGGRTLLLDGADTQLVDAHTFVVTGESMTDQPNVPVRLRAETNGTGSQALDWHWNAVHYSRSSREADVRLNGERRAGTDVDTSWEPLISWQKRTGWEQVNTRAILILVASDTDLALDLQLDTSLNGASFSTPTHTTSSEAAIEFDTSATGFSSTGERRWIGQITGGQGSNKESGAGSLGFNLPTGRILTLAAKADASNATVDATVVTGSEF